MRGPDGIGRTTQPRSPPSSPSSSLVFPRAGSEYPLLPPRPVVGSPQQVGRPLPSIKGRSMALLESFPSSFLSIRLLLLCYLLFAFLLPPFTSHKSSGLCLTVVSSPSHYSFLSSTHHSPQYQSHVKSSSDLLAGVTLLLPHHLTISSSHHGLPSKLLSQLLSPHRGPLQTAICHLLPPDSGRVRWLAPRGCRIRRLQLRLDAVIRPLWIFGDFCRVRRQCQPFRLRQCVLRQWRGYARIHAGPLRRCLQSPASRPHRGDPGANVSPPKIAGIRIELTPETVLAC